MRNIALVGIAALSLVGLAYGLLLVGTNTGLGFMLSSLSSLILGYVVGMYDSGKNEFH